jgi:hypothetical protein
VSFNLRDQRENWLLKQRLIDERHDTSCRVRVSIGRSTEKSFSESTGVNFDLVDECDFCD